MTDARVTQVAVEEWSSGADAQLTQMVVEQWGSTTVTTGYAIVTQLAVEQWAKIDAAGRKRRRVMVAT